MCSSFAKQAINPAKKGKLSGNATTQLSSEEKMDTHYEVSYHPLSLPPLLIRSLPSSSISCTYPPFGTRTRTPSRLLASWLNLGGMVCTGVAQRSVTVFVWLDTIRRVCSVLVVPSALVVDVVER